MPQITATILVPITVNWTKDGVADGEQTAVATAVVHRTVDDPVGWGAVGNWTAGQGTAAIQAGGTSSSSSGYPSSSSSGGGP